MAAIKLILKLKNSLYDDIPPVFFNTIYFFLLVVLLVVTVVTPNVLFDKIAKMAISYITIYYTVLKSKLTTFFYFPKVTFIHKCMNFAVVFIKIPRN